MPKFSPRVMLTAALLSTSVGATSSSWCRYTVRDVGFVDLGSVPYELEVRLPAEGSDLSGEDLTSISRAVLGESNVRSRLTIVGEGDAGPGAVLIAPDGRSQEIALGAGLDSDSLFGALGRVLHSPRREEILQHIVEAYAVVVLAEAEDEAENRTATAAVESAMAEIAAHLDDLPKPVERGPYLVRIGREERMAERLLCFGLDLDSTSPAAQVAILVGRGRRVGPVFRGSDVTKAGVLAVLSVIGQSCECDLDRSWMQGPMMPHQWDAGMQSQVIETLGFDAENPMVKTEISRILGRSARNRELRTDPLDLEMDELLLGYSEEVLELPDEEPVPAAGLHGAEPPPLAGGRAADPSAASESGPSAVAGDSGEGAAAADREEATGMGALRVLLLVGAALAVASLGVGAVILLKGRNG